MRQQRNLRKGLIIQIKGDIKLKVNLCENWRGRKSSEEVAVKLQHYDGWHYRRWGDNLCWGWGRWRAQVNGKPHRNLLSKDGPKQANSSTSCHGKKDNQNLLQREVYQWNKCGSMDEFMLNHDFDDDMCKSWFKQIGDWRVRVSYWVLHDSKVLKKQEKD
jgi:hypothetical protein